VRYGPSRPQTPHRHTALIHGERVSHGALHPFTFLWRQLLEERDLRREVALISFWVA
jgi:hypothetical protein